MDEIKLSYVKEVRSFKEVLDVTALVSSNQHNIDTDGRGVRSVKIFTRQTLTGISLSRILPHFGDGAWKEDEFWDVCTIASLARNLLEGYTSLYFFGLEKVDSCEAELRFLIMQYHRNSEWFNIRKKLNPDDVNLIDFSQGIADEEKRIKAHPSFLILSKYKQGLVLNRGNEMYKTKDDFSRELEVCSNIVGEFRILSNLVHPLPLSFERIDNDRGRGVENEPDITYSVLCLNIARRYLAASTVGIVEHFPKELGILFPEIDKIRAFTKDS